MCFFNPTITSVFDPNLREQWNEQLQSLSEWEETFLLAEKSDLNREVKQVSFEEKKLNMEKAKKFVTP